MVEQQHSMPDYRSPEWVAEQLGIDRQTVYKFLNEGMLPAVQLGRRWLISESRLVEFLGEMERTQTEDRRVVFELAYKLMSSPALLSEDGQAALARAKEEAGQRRHNYIGQEHILLSFAADPACAAARLLERLGVDPQRARAAVETVIGDGDSSPEAEQRFTPRASRAIWFALEETPDGGAGSDHLLLGLLLEGNGIGAALLNRLGVTLDDARRVLDADDDGEVEAGE